MTTTDDFTEAARAEADDRFLIDPDHPGQVTKEWIAIFEAGAEWARDHLAQANPLTEVIRAVATTTPFTGQDIANVGHALAKIMDPEPTDAEVDAAKRAHERHSRFVRQGELGPSKCIECGHEYNAHNEGLSAHAMRAALTAARKARRRLVACPAVSASTAPTTTATPTPTHPRRHYREEHPMSSDQPYAPSDEDVLIGYVRGVTVDGYGSVWEELTPGARAGFAAWLAAHDARVRRDAAMQAEARLGAVEALLDERVTTLDDEPLHLPVPHDTLRRALCGD